MYVHSLARSHRATDFHLAVENYSALAQILVEQEHHHVRQIVFATWNDNASGGGCPQETCYRVFATQQRLDALETREHDVEKVVSAADQLLFRGTHQQQDLVGGRPYPGLLENRPSGKLAR